MANTEDAQSQRGAGTTAASLGHASRDPAASTSSNTTKKDIDDYMTALTQALRALQPYNRFGLNDCLWSLGATGLAYSLFGDVGGTACWGRRHRRLGRFVHCCRMSRRHREQEQSGEYHRRLYLSHLSRIGGCGPFPLGTRDAGVRYVGCVGGLCGGQGVVSFQ